MDERNFTYMAYGLITAWAILMIYVVTLASREKKLRSELERVRHMIEDREKK